MKKTYTLLAVLFLVTGAAFAQKTSSVTFTVDMSAYVAAGGSISPCGVHVAGNFQTPLSWVPSDSSYKLIDMGNNIFSGTFIISLDSFPLKFKFINSQQASCSWGDVHTDQESLSGDCTDATDDNRFIAENFGAESFLFYAADWDSCTGSEITLTGISNADQWSDTVSVFPNPASAEIRIKFSLVNAERIHFVLRNYTGEAIRSLSDEFLSAGAHEAAFDVSDLTNGIYFIGFEASGKQINKPLQIIK
ncbi:MAG: T9SS type A sorting domain-containing protein [Chitinophagales bacterium]|nr:T9SS type A sorting domain-containing protein [Chitinophagales bacterium]